MTNMKRKLMLASLGLLMISGAANADEKNDAIGLGMVTCAGFAQRYKLDPSGAEKEYYNWFSGFVTGANFVMNALGKPRKALTATSVEDKESALRKYCNEHPLGLYADAVLSVLIALPDLPDDKVQR
jgi:hypothetical protein